MTSRRPKQLSREGLARLADKYVSETGGPGAEERAKQVMAKINPDVLARLLDEPPHGALPKQRP